jgi:hypothetical protein
VALESGEFTVARYNSPKIVSLLEFFALEADHGTGVPCFTIGFVDSTTKECVAAMGMRLNTSLSGDDTFLRVSGIAGATSLVPLSTCIEAISAGLIHLVPASGRSGMRSAASGMSGMRSAPTTYVCPDSIQLPLNEAIARVFEVNPGSGCKREDFVLQQYEEVSGSNKHVDNDSRIEEELTQDSLDLLTRNWVTGSGWVKRYNRIRIN